MYKVNKHVKSTSFDPADVFGSLSLDSDTVVLQSLTDETNLSDGDDISTGIDVVVSCDSTLSPDEIHPEIDGTSTGICATK